MDSILSFFRHSLCNILVKCIIGATNSYSLAMLRLDVIDFIFMYYCLLNIYVGLYSIVCILIYIYCLDELTTHLISLVWIELED